MFDAFTRVYTSSIGVCTSSAILNYFLKIFQNSQNNLDFHQQCLTVLAVSHLPQHLVLLNFKFFGKLVDLKCHFRFCFLFSLIISGFSG